MPHYLIHSFRWTALALMLGALLVPYEALAQKIVFQSRRDGDAEIYVMDGDGANPTNVSNNPAGDFTPFWSPDGTRILFGSNRVDSDEIYVMDADGGNLTRLTNNLDVDRAVAWSPDGLHILFWSDRDESEEVYIMAADGNDVVRLTDNPAIDLPFQFSPDGSRVVFTSDRTGNRDIFIVQIDRGGLANLTADPGLDGFPQWSPDGTRISFISDREGHQDVYTMDAATGTGIMRLTTNAAKEDGALWSPDGSTLLFRSDRVGYSAPFTIGADGSGLTPLTNASGMAPQEMEWSPDGSRILYRLGSAIFIVNADGTNPVNLTNVPSFESNFNAFGDFGSGTPAISPGGIVSANLAPLVTTISPLSIVSIFGTNFAKQNIFFPTVTASGQLARILGEMCFEVDGQRVPIFAVTPTQANIQVSKTGAVGPVGVVAIRGCDTADEVRSAVEMVTLEEATPVFFLFPPRTNDGLIATRFNADAVAVAPAGMFTDQFGVSRPAKPGDIIVLYGTGWGETEAGFGTGELATVAAELLESADAMVTFGGVPLAEGDIFYVGVTPQTAGLYQLVIRVPAGAQAGNNEVVLTAYGKSTPVGPVIPVVVP